MPRLSAGMSFTPPAVRPPSVLTRLFNQVARIKLAPGYTDVIGTDLGIIGAADTAEHPVATFKLSVVQGATGQGARITFTKFGHLGVVIESRRGNGTWEFLAIDTETPYLDERPLLVAGQPETREYRCAFGTENRPVPGARCRRSRSERENRVGPRQAIRQQRPFVASRHTSLYRRNPPAA
ncbi:MAG: hypothetical protein HY000_18645 [Planctomycetes bacterium]|nr:hypothetical protein [Planctomycetota bacterium]